MGGHGGLNILPQKSWNVYNRDNLEKVAKDEREHVEAQALKRKETLDAEFQDKFQTLKAKKRRHTGADRQAILIEERADEVGGHINLFAIEEEAAQGDEEYAAEKAQEKLVEKKQWQVQLGRSNCYGGDDINHRPWWSEQPVPLDVDKTEEQAQAAQAALTAAEINRLPVEQRWARVRAITEGRGDETVGVPELLCLKPKKEKKQSKKKEKKVCDQHVKCTACPVVPQM